MAEKPAATEEKYISKAPIRRLMKNQGANLVAEEAVITLVEFLEKFADGLTKKAMKIAEDDKRKKLTADDINAALKVK
jgi:histone H3/H4